MPEALVEGGYITPAGLAKALGAELLRETAPGVYLLRRPLQVMPGATLHIDQATKDFRLSSDRGAFIINDGKLFITDSRVTAWREKEDRQDWFDKKGASVLSSTPGAVPRPTVGSTISSLGYTGEQVLRLLDIPVQPVDAPEDAAWPPHRLAAQLAVGRHTRYYFPNIF